LFHARKAAGTTLRAFLQGRCASVSRLRRARLRGASGGCLFESEGLALDARLLPLADRAGILTVATLRHPVSRCFTSAIFFD
jgi:hypothetical protein